MFYIFIYFLYLLQWNCGKAFIMPAEGAVAQQSDSLVPFSNPFTSMLFGAVSRRGGNHVIQFVFFLKVVWVPEKSPMWRAWALDTLNAAIK